MNFFVEDKGASFERGPAGAHLARCYRVIDLGTQKSEYMGQVKFLHKVMIGWELHVVDDDGNAVTMRDGRPFAIFKNYTLSWSEKANLRLDLQAWRGKPFSQDELRRFDLSTILGAWCMLNVIDRQGQNGNTYSNVNGITPVPAMIRQRGLPKAVNSNEIFTLQAPDIALFESFSDNLKAKIKSSPEWQRLDPSDAPSTTQDDDSDIPF